MITVQLNEAEFEYDIHSLVKAFYPQREVLVRAADRESFPESAFHLTVAYDRDGGRIVFSFYGGSQTDGGEDDGHTAAPELRGEVSVDFADRRETKNRLKRKLYELLAQYAGRTLPWGTLTGIRPTKIPMEFLEAGRTRSEIRAYMREAYYASEEKIDLSIAVAERELKLLRKIDYEDGYSLYIGIPFCPSTCLYCSFTSYPLAKWAARVDEYLDALEKEIRFTAQACRKKRLNTVYIGGGTPTTLTPDQLERLITMIGGQFGLFGADGKIAYAPSGGEADAGPGEIGAGSSLLEFTVEAGRPDSITREKLDVLRKYGISRISINPQTMNEQTLRLIGRQHTVQQIRDSFYLAREMGFDNINMDLIVGLPEEGIDEVRHTMEELRALAPDNITVHSLAVKRAARLRMKREDYGHLHIENTWETIRLTADCCREMGMEPYYLYRQKNMAGNFENVGYAKPGAAGIYNVLIMEEKQTIMALGAGAITKFVLDGASRIERVENVKDLANYLARIDEMTERKRRRMEELQWL